MEKPFTNQDCIIQSKDNKWFKLINSIRQNKKEKDKYFLAEGEKLIESLLKKFKPFAIFTYEDSGLQSSIEYNKENYEIHIFSHKLWKELSEVEAPQRLIAIFERPDFELNFLDNISSVLVLDQIQDPGNLGTLIRTAVASGWENIICLKGSVDPYSPKVVRASAGSLALAQIYCKVTHEDLIQYLENSSLEIFSTSSYNAVSSNEFYFKKVSKPCLILGNEGRGIETNWLEKLREKKEIVDLKIPMQNEEVVESLNVAIAGALLMYKIKGLV